ncbi:hypothetical protein EXIGLDRAFT_753333 [Exidia glandulosa HHB12029]|uniref:DUF6534 domain-containing protein n=1 Tax=Exidia glandulosa HHB12029 TaxID=1314781 RepID=A0A165DVA2_EXIGL|nr:hypothetical protein EXIGLDRAFT_846423 [Exidia glandulosa HHB12029]KZV85442.1 hypothetical protein EXIGLDRAFT_753333 [Exidia glandulosa HHB12029]
MASHAVYDVRLTLGAFEVAVTITCFLVGVLMLQTFNYFRDFQDDPTSTKLTVGAVFIGDFLHSALLMHAIHHYTIINFGHPEKLHDSVWSLNATIVLSGLIALAVQAFFCARVLRVTKSKILGGACFVLVLLRFAFSFMLAINTCISNSISDVETKFKWQLVAALSIGTASDIAIAGCICGTLWSNRTGFKPTDALVDKIIAFVLSSGLLTSVIAVLEIVTFLTMENFVWLAFYCILAKIFSNSLLASLNERTALRQSKAFTDRAITASTRPGPQTQAGSVMIFKHTSVELHENDRYNPEGSLDAGYSPRDKSFGLVDAV